MCIGDMVGSVTAEDEEIEIYEERLGLQVEGKNISKGWGGENVPRLSSTIDDR